MKHRLLLLSLVIISLIVGLAIAEVVVRVVQPSRIRVVQLKKFRESERAKFSKYDPMLGWSGLADANDDFQWADVLHHVRQNRYGYRGKGYEFKRTDKKRLLVLGDSFVWGFGVDNENIFTSVMEKEAKGEIEVVNTGVSGYGTDQELLLWREQAHKWKPDHVLLMVTVTNDLLDVTSSSRYGYKRPYFVLQEGALKLKNVPVPKDLKPWNEPAMKAGFKANRTLAWTLEHSVVMNLFIEVAASSSTVNKWLMNRGVLMRKQIPHIWDKREYLIYLERLDGKANRAWKLFFALIEEMDKEVRAHGADFTVVLIPPVYYVYPELWEDYLKSIFMPATVKLSFNAPGRRISKWGAKKGIRVIDLSPDLEGKEGTYFPINRHWTALGHKIVARSLLDQL